MEFQLFDLLMVIIIFQLVVFCIFLLLKGSGRLSNYLLAVQLFSQAAGIFVSFTFRQFAYFFNNAPYSFYLGFSFFFLWGPTFYLYIKSVGYTDYKFSLRELLHLLPAIIITLFLMNTYFFAGTETQQYLLSSRSYIINQYGFYLDMFVRLQVLFYIILSIRLYFIIKNKFHETYSSSVNTTLLWIRFMVAGFTLCYFVTVPINIYLNITKEYPLLLLVLNILPYFIFFNIIFIKGWLHPELFSGIVETAKYKSSKLTSPEAHSWIKTLNSYMENEKPFMNPELTLTQLAENIGSSPRVLSQVINEYFSQNFHDYINKLRVEESKKLLVTSPGKTILEILYEVGFNTKSAYNVAFKKTTGFTPTEFRKQSVKKTIEQV